MSEQVKFNISEVSRLIGISRTALYRNYINKGILIVNRDTKKATIQLVELLRVFPNITLPNTKTVTEFTQVDTQKTTAEHDLERENKLLYEQLKQAQEREQWLKSQIDDLRQQQGYLLENKQPKIRKKWLGIF